MGGSLTQFGIGKESVYGTAVTVTKFYEIMKESLKGKYQRSQAAALSSSYVDRSDRFNVADQGASGSVTIEPLTKGFNNWLRFMMGDVATTGPTETNAYTHTAGMASLSGDMLTVQIGRSDTTDTVKPWTYEGGKVTGFEFSNQVDQTLQCSIDMDFEKESNPDAPAGAYALATNVPVTGAEVYTWQEGSVTIGGSAYDISDLSIKVDNGLKVDQYYIGSTKREPTQNDKRKVTFSFKTPYKDNGLWKKVSSATNAGSYAAIVAKWTGLTLLGTTIYPSIQLSIPVARFDEGGPVVEGPGTLEQTVSGIGLYNGTDSALTITVVSGDTICL